MIADSQNTLSMCSPYGDSLYFVLSDGRVFMLVNDKIINHKDYSGNIRNDAELLTIQGYDE